MSAVEVKADDDKVVEDFEVQENDAEQTNHLGYSVAKVPVHASILITSLVANYRTTDFLPNFMQFLKFSFNTSHSAKAPTTTSALPVCKCVIVRLPAAPQVTTLITKDIIHVCAATPA